MRPTLRDLSGTLKATVRVGVLDGPNLMQASFGPHSLGADAFSPLEFVPSVQPVWSTARGRVLAFASPGLGHDNEVPAVAGVSPEKVRQVLSNIRVNRVAVVRERSNGGAARGAIAMPVFGPGGGILAAIEIVVADVRTGLACAQATLAVAGGSLSRVLTTVDADDEPA